MCEPDQTGDMTNWHLLYIHPSNQVFWSIGPCSKVHFPGALCLPAWFLQIEQHNSLHLSYSPLHPSESHFVLYPALPYLPLPPFQAIC